MFDSNGCSKFEQLLTFNSCRNHNMAHVVQIVTDLIVTDLLDKTWHVKKVSLTEDRWDFIEY